MKKAPLLSSLVAVCALTALLLAWGCHRHRKSKSAPNTDAYSTNLHQLVEKKALPPERVDTTKVPNLRWPDFSDYELLDPDLLRRPQLRSGLDPRRCPHSHGPRLHPAIQRRSRQGPHPRRLRRTALARPHPGPQRQVRRRHLPLRRRHDRQRHALTSPTSASAASIRSTSTSTSTSPTKNTTSPSSSPTT